MQAVLREWREAERRLSEALGSEREVDLRVELETVRREYQRLSAAETDEEFDHSDAGSGAAGPPGAASLE